MSEGDKVLTRRVMEQASNEGNLDISAPGLGLVLLLVFVLMAALLVMILPSTADAKKHHHRARPVASAHGQGVASDNEPFKFYVETYKSYPNDAATGTFLVTRGKDFVQGKVTCFRYAKAPDGTRRANFAGPITKTNLPDHHFGAFWVTDSGKPNGVGDLYNAFNAPTGKCTSWNPGGTAPLKSGNVVVNTVRTVGVSENTSSPKQMNEGAVGLFDDLPG